MRLFLHVLSVLVMIALAFWAYRENYRTQEALARAERLQQQIAVTRQRLRMLRAEWAYLNRPDRLRDLAEMNYERLGLLPMMPDRFGRVDQVAYPPAPAPAPAPVSAPASVPERHPVAAAARDPGAAPRPAAVAGAGS